MLLNGTSNSSDLQLEELVTVYLTGEPEGQQRAAAAIRLIHPNIRYNNLFTLSLYIKT